VTLCTSLYSKIVNDVAWVLAVLAAKGKSKIRNISQIDRGYDSMEGKLRSLGAHIERVLE